MRSYPVYLFVSCALLFSAVSGCTQLPTERQGVTDMRPQLSFKYENPSFEGGRVLVDGLDVGSVGDYRDGKASLKVLPGMHVVRIVIGNQIVIEEKVYMGDGVNRAILVQ